MTTIKHVAAEMLGRNSLFAPLDPALRLQIVERMREVSFAAGQTIFVRGDPGDTAYLVIDGRVRLSVLTIEGRELSFNHAASGSIFGEVSALDQSPRTADATAVTPTTLMALAGTDLRSSIESNGALATAAIRFLCARLREADQQLEAIALCPIEMRLARFLLSAVALQSHNRPVAKATLRLDMSQSDLALLIGASRPKVNAAIAALEEAGAITRVGDEMLCDCEALRAAAALTADARLSGLPS